MPITVNLPNGAKAVFPDGTSKDVMKAAIQKKFPPTAPAAPPPPAAGPLDFLTQGMSGLNEGIAQGLGAPVDLATAGINLGIKGVNALAHTGVTEIEHPVGGSEMFKSVLAPTIKAETSDPSLQVMRRVAQELGAWAVPGGGAVAKAAKPLKTLGHELAGALGSGVGAATMQQVAPGNPIAEIAGQVVGGLTPANLARMGERGPKPLPKMTVEDLRTEKTDAYKAADNVGAVYTPQAYDNLLGNVVKEAQADHISPTRHKMAHSFIEDMIGRRGKPYSLTDLDQLRQEVRRDLIVPSYSSQERAADGHFGHIILDNIDNMLANAKPGDLLSGSGPEAVAAIIKARALNTRYRKAETLADAFYQAQLAAASSGSGGNLNNALRQKIKAILTNKKRIAPFSADERTMMENLVKQGTAEEILRWAGKASPGGNGLIGVMEILATMHNPLAAALPVGGMIAKGIADAGTLKKMDHLQQTVATGSSALPTLPPRPLALPSKSLVYAQAANQDKPRPLSIIVRGGSAR